MTERERMEAAFRNLIPGQAQKTPTIKDYREALETTVEIIRGFKDLRTNQQVFALGYVDEAMSEKWLQEQEKAFDLLASGFLTTIDDPALGFNLPTDSEEDDDL